MALLDREEPPASGHVPEGRADRGREVRRPLAAGLVLLAEGRVAADLLVGRLRVPEEVARRVRSDHHRAVDAGGVAPGVDHRRAGAGALAEQVDAFVAERLARCFQVVDPLRKRVAREVDAVVGEPVRAGPEGVGALAERRLAEEVGRALHRRLDLGAVEPDGAVHAAVADEDDVAVGNKPAGGPELHVRDPGAALEAEDRLGRLRRPGVDPGHRQRDQPRLGVGAVLGNDERPAVGLVATVLGGVGTALEGEVAGLGAGGHRDRVRRGEAEIAEAARHERDQGEGNDPSGGQVTGHRGVLSCRGGRADDGRAASPGRRRCGGLARAQPRRTARWPKPTSASSSSLGAMDVEPRATACSSGRVPSSVRPRTVTWPPSACARISSAACSGT